MNEETRQVIAGAVARADSRESRRVPPDYKAANVTFRKQKAALTRAVNSRDADKVVAACVKAVREWREAPFNGAWPDDWSRWQRALDDVLPWNASVELKDLR